MSSDTLIQNYYEEDGERYYLFEKKDNDVTYQYSYSDNATALKNALYFQPNLYKSSDNNYYCNSNYYKTIYEPSGEYDICYHYVYSLILPNTTFDSNTEKIYIAPIIQGNADDIFYLKDLGANLAPVLIANTLKYNHPELFANIHINGFQVNEKIYASDINLLKERLQQEINRRSRTSDTASQAIWTSTNGKTNWGIDNTLSATLAAFTQGGRATASDINTLLNTLNAITTDSYWSNSQAVSAGNLIQVLLNAENALTKIESGLDQISENGIKNNYTDNIGSPRGNTSGCNTACKGLCQSCLGMATDSGSGGGGNGGCDSCSVGCLGTCGSCGANCQYTCTGYCWTGCGTSARF